MNATILDAPESSLERALAKSIEWTSPHSRVFARTKCLVDVDNTTMDSFQDLQVLDDSANVFAQAIALLRIVTRRTTELNTVDSVVVYDKTVPILRVRMKSENPVRVLTIDIHNFLRHLAIENDAKTSTNRQFWFVGVFMALTFAIHMFYVYTPPVLHSHTGNPTKPWFDLTDVVSVVARSSTLMNLLRKFT